MKFENLEFYLNDKRIHPNYINFSAFEKKDYLLYLTLGFGKKNDNSDNSEDYWHGDIIKVETKGEKIIFHLKRDTV